MKTMWKKGKCVPFFTDIPSIALLPCTEISEISVSNFVHSHRHLKQSQLNEYRHNIYTHDA